MPSRSVSHFSWLSVVALFCSAVPIANGFASLWASPRLASDGLSAVSNDQLELNQGQGLTTSPSTNTRRQALMLLPALIAAAAPTVSNAAVRLNDDGEYVDVEDVDWQTAWKERLDKAQSMSPDEVFNAARGAGNVDLKEGPESEASRKRRAMSACRDAGLRAKAGASDPKKCTARVFAGEVDFILGDM